MDVDLDDFPVPINARVRQAMAITGGVALDIDLSVDDVRHALRVPKDKSASARQNLPKRRKIRGQNTL
jgi:hypothetical protein